ncbi:MAG: hypothetical protein DRG78_11745 [Epsilonproteobacteria bacterium]|nr:MAG: hypothetical protein DRG78_11745 [Campylobacterota bacterium]
MNLNERKKQTILVVDDNKINIDILLDLLKGYDVITALNGQMAIDIALEENIDLILLDIMMPNMDGYEVCQRLKAIKMTKNIPIIFLTAKIDEDSIEKAYNMGGTDYVTKPFKPKELLSRVKKELKIQNLIHKEIEHNKHIALKELLCNIAHQWRQPLSVISAVSSGMQMKKNNNILLDDDFNKCCESINENVLYLSKVIDNFRNFLQDDNEKLIFNLTDNINSFLNIVDVIIKSNNINIVLNLQDDIQINGYQNGLTQCLINIFNNSNDVLEKIDEDNRYLFLSTSKDNDKVIIKIKDNAGGISVDILSKIFEPYFTTKHQAQGIGLSLHTTYNLIVNNMNGTIDVKNVNYEYNNQNHTGAEFIITLPIG